MGYTLGIDLGTSRTAAAVYRNGRADIVPLSDHTATMPSMVFVREDASLVVGEAARRRGHEDPARLAREFKRRFGDSTPLVLGGTSLTAEQLTATLLRHVVDHVAQREGGLPDRVVVAHPANWGTYRRDLLRTEVAKAGLPPAQLVSEPDAAAVHYASGERQAVGEIIGVYDLGGGTFDAAILRRIATGWEQLGEPKGIERLGGIDFDEAVFGYVAAESGLDSATVTDADTAALVRLRDDCQAAKEALSDDLETTVPVMVAGLNTRVKLTRTELEAMIRPSIRSSVECLRTAILDAGLQPEQISAVLMVGGSSRIPLASEMVRLELKRPVVFTSNPKEAVALGAARIGAGPEATAVDAPLAPTPAAGVPRLAPPPLTTVQRVAAPPVAPLAPPAAPLAARPPAGPASIADAGASSPRRKLLIAAGAVVAIAVGVGAALALKGDDKKAGSATTVAATDEPTTLPTTAASTTAITDVATTTAELTTVATTIAPTTVVPATELPTTVAVTTPATLPAEDFVLYSQVAPHDFTQDPDSLVPPGDQATPIADGVYFGDASVSSGSSSGLRVTLTPFFTGAACEKAAAEAGQECLDGSFGLPTPTYDVPVEHNAFISINVEDSTDHNFRITEAELTNLLQNGGFPTQDVGAPDPFFFQNFYMVTVVNGQAVRLEGFFTS